MIKFISIILSVTFVAGCSTVAGVGQDVQDIANWGRNKIVENANKKEVLKGNFQVSWTGANYLI